MATDQPKPRWIPADKMKTLLLTGASGFLGWHICESADSRWQVIGTYHEHRARADLISVDIADYGAWKKCFDNTAPDAVIHTAAMTRPNDCATQPELLEDAICVADSEVEAASLGFVCARA